MQTELFHQNENSSSVDHVSTYLRHLKPGFPFLSSVSPSNCRTLRRTWTLSITGHTIVTVHEMKTDYTKREQHELSASYSSVPYQVLSHKQLVDK